MCDGAASAGVKFDDKQRIWKPFADESNSKFSLKITAKELNQTTLFGDRVDAMAYSVEVSRQGTEPELCQPDKNFWVGNRDSLFPAILKNGFLKCKTLSTVYQINVNTGRFLEIREFGYVNGDDADVGNTPSMAIGRCNRLK